MKIFEKNDALLQEEYAHDKKQASGDFSDSVQMHYLKKGTTVVRVLPCYSDKGVWFREIVEHAVNVNGQFRQIACQRQYGLPCPFCEEGERLYNSGVPENIKLADDFKPRKQYLFNVIVFSSPDGDTPAKGVQVMKAGRMVKRQLLDLDMDAVCCGDITNIQTGFNIRIARTGDKLKTEYTARNLPQRTDIVLELANQGIDFNSLELVDLDSLFPPKPYDYLKNMINNSAAAPGFPSVAHTPITKSEGTSVQHLEPNGPLGVSFGQITAVPTSVPIAGSPTFNPPTQMLTATQKKAVVYPSVTPIARPKPDLQVVPTIPDPPQEV